MERTNAESKVTCSHLRNEAEGDFTPALVYEISLSRAICQRCFKFVNRSGNEELFNRLFDTAIPIESYPLGYDGSLSPIELALWNETGGLL